MTSKVSFYCSRLNGNKICWPVELINTTLSPTAGGGWCHVRGLAGRFKGRSFTVVGSEISSYVPKGYKLAPGAKAFLPKLSYEYASAKKLHTQSYKLLSGAQSSGSIPVATAQQLLKKVEALAFTLQPRTPFDRAWKDYGKDIEEAQAQIERRNGTYAVGQLHSALGMIEGAASREKEPEHGRDPFFGKRLGSRAKSRLSEGREKQKFDRLYTGFKNEGSSATTAYRKAIRMMPGYHTPEAQKAWLEDLAEYEKHAHLINKKDEFHLSLRDPKRDPIIRKVGKKFVLYSIKTGKRLGTHPSRAAALSQERAIHVNKRDPSHGRLGTGRKYYVVDQVQGGPAGGLWYQVGHFSTKASAEAFRKRLIGKTRTKHTFPGHDYKPLLVGTHVLPSDIPKSRRDPTMSKSYFIIATRLNEPKYGGQGLPWTTMRWTMVGNTDRTGTMRFETKAEAEKVIREVRTYGPDWYAAEYKIMGEREITTSSRGKRSKR